MDNRECTRGCQSCWDSVQKGLQKPVADLNGTFETVGFYEDGSGKDNDHHRVIISIPCSRPRDVNQGGLIGTTVVGGGNVAARASGNSCFAGGLEIFSIGQDSEGVCCGNWGSDGTGSLDDADILPEAELNQILEGFMESAEELNAYYARYGDESITVTNEQLLHAAIDKHLARKSTSNRSTVSEWKSPLFNNVEVGSTTSNSEVVPTFKIKEEPEEDEEEKMDVSKEDTTFRIKEEPEDDEEEKMDVSNSVQLVQQQGPRSAVQKIGASNPPSYSFATLTTVPSSSSNPQHIRQQLIPQVTVPMSTVNQVAYAMAAAASQNQILRPANLPAVSALMGNGGAQSFNWALAQYSYSTVAGTPAAIIRTNPKPAAPFVPSGLLTKSSSTEVASRASLSTVVARIRCRKTSPLQIKETNDLPVAVTRTRKEEVIPKLTSDIEGPKLPDGRSYEAYILDEGLNRVRRLGLHRTDDKTDYPFKCPLCEKKYRNPNGIKYHAKYGHGPKAIFTCSICQRDYATRHGLAAHKRTHQAVDESAKLEGGSRNQDKSSKNVTAIVFHQAAPRRT